MNHSEILPVAHVMNVLKVTKFKSSEGIVEEMLLKSGR